MYIDITVLDESGTRKLLEMPVASVPILVLKDTKHASVLREFATSDSGATRYIVAGNRNTPADVLTVLARDPDVDVRRAVAENFSTPAEVLVMYLDDPTIPLHGYVGRLHGLVTPEFLATYAHNKEFVRSIAHNHPDRGDLFADHPDPELRAVALPAQKAAKDPHWYVRYRAPVDSVDSNDPDELVRARCWLYAYMGGAAFPKHESTFVRAVCLNGTHEFLDTLARARFADENQ